MMAKKALRLPQKIPFIGTLVVALVLLAGLVFTLQAVHQRTSNQGRAAIYSGDFSVSRFLNGGFENWEDNGLPIYWFLEGKNAQIEKSTDSYQGQFAVKLVKNQTFTPYTIYFFNPLLFVFAPGEYVLKLHYKSLGSHPGGGAEVWQWKSKEFPEFSSVWKQRRWSKPNVETPWKKLTEASFENSLTYTTLTTPAFKIRIEDIKITELKPYKTTYVVALGVGEGSEATPILVDSISFERVR